MINYSTLKPDLYSVVRDIIPVQYPVIFDRQSGPEPAKPYCTIRLTNLQQIHRKTLGAVDVNGAQEVRVTYSIGLEFRVIGDNAMSIGQLFDSSFSKESALDKFQSIGLYYYDKSIVRDTPQLLSTRWEDRSIQSVSFYTVDVSLDNTGWIEQFELEATYKDESGDIVIQNTNIVSVVTP